MIWQRPWRLRLALRTTGFGGFGLDRPRPLPAGVLLS